MQLILKSQLRVYIYINEVVQYQDQWSYAWLVFWVRSPHTNCLQGKHTTVLSFGQSGVYEVAIPARTGTERKKWGASTELTTCEFWNPRNFRLFSRRIPNSHILIFDKFCWKYTATTNDPTHAITYWNRSFDAEANTFTGRILRIWSLKSHIWELQTEVQSFVLFFHH